MADYREEPADESGYFAMAQEKPFHFHKLLLGNPDIFAVLEHQGTPEIVGGKVVGIGTDETADCAHEDYQPDIHCALLGQVAGRRHDQFARHRDDGALHRHQDEISPDIPWHSW